MSSSSSTAEREHIITATNPTHALQTSLPATATSLQVQREQYDKRVAAQQRRLAQQEAEKQRQIADRAAQAQMKQQVIEQAQAQQKAQDEARKNAILMHEQKKDERMAAKTAREV